MVAFRSGPRPSGESLKKINESRKSKIEKAFKEDNMEMAPGGPKKTIQSKTKIIKGRKLIEKKSGGRIGLKAGSKGCKLAMKGKGRAYGKNS